MADEQDRPDAENVADSEKKPDLIKSSDPDETIEPKSDEEEKPAETVESEAAPVKAKQKLPKLSGGLWASIGAVAILLVGAIAVAVFFYLQYSDEKNKNDAGVQASQALCAFSPTLVKIDWQNIDVYFKDVLDGSTGEFHKEFEGAAAQLKDTLVQGQVKSEQKDAQCGIQSASKDHAEILLTLGQSVTTITMKDPQVRQLAMVASMEKVDGRWLVAKLDAPWLRAQ